MNFGKKKKEEEVLRHDVMEFSFTESAVGVSGFEIMLIYRS